MLQQETNKELTMIAVDKLHAHPDNPRKGLGDLSELTESIRKNGIMQNLSVLRQETKPDEFTVLIGHRRLAAAKAAGLSEVPCRIIEKMDQREQLALMLEENLQREDLTVREQAEGFQMMLDLGETVSTIAQKTGFSEGTIRHRVEIAKLDKDALQEKTEMFQLSITDLMKLEQVSSVEERNEILKGSQNGRELEDKISRWVRKSKISTNTPKIISELEALGVKPETEDVHRNYYSSKYETKETIRLEDSETVPDKVGKWVESFKAENPKSDIWYTNRYGYEIELIIKKKNTREKKEETEYDRRKKVNKKLKDVHKRLSDYRRTVLADVVQGKRKKITEKEQKSVIDFCWPVVRDMYRIAPSGYQTVTGKSAYSSNGEDYKKYLELPMWLVMLCGVEATFSDYRELFDYNNEYCPETGEKTKEYHNILHRLFGFTLEDEELQQYVDGTHELYKKEEPEKTDSSEAEVA